MSKENKNKDFIKLPIELSEYHISFMPDYTGFLYVEADSGEVEIQTRGKISFKEKLTKFYLEKNLYVIINNPINLRSIKFVEFSKQNDCPQLNTEIQNQKTIIDILIKKYMNS